VRYYALKYCDQVPNGSDKCCLTNRADITKFGLSTYSETVYTFSQLGLSGINYSIAKYYIY